MLIEPTFLRWVFGAIVVLGFGHYGTRYFHARLKQHVELPNKETITSGDKRVPAVVTGTIERLFFFVLVGCGVPGAPAAMVGWLGIKLVTNWNHPDWKDSPRARTRAFVALLSGLVSMLYALIGGAIASGAVSVGI